MVWVASLATVTVASGQTSCPWVGSSAPVVDRARQVLAQMTFDEKLHMVHGSATGLFDAGGPIYTGLIRAVPRLCIPQLALVDGPAGTGNEFTGVTQLPAPVALAAGWDPELARGYGDVIGAEDLAKGANVALGPAVDLLRDPRAGRGFEALGEDPHLMSRLAVSEVQAIQSHGVIAQAKHYAVYTQETLRDTELGDAIVDERTLHEIYLPAFEAAVTEGGVGSVMCSYNFVNGVHACSHPYLLSQVLKGQWGFDGFVTSDWFATHDSAAAANAGLDMQMPDHCYFGPALQRAIEDGRVPGSRLDDMVLRILRSMFRMGLFDREPSGSPDAVVTTPEHAAFARAVAEQGTVLLKNEGPTLPLDPTRIRSIALIGRAADEGAITAGGGSAHVIAPYVVTPVDGIRARAGAVQVTFDDGTNPLQAAAAARSADVAIVFAALLQGESKDRSTLELFPTDTVLIEQVARANPDTIVVLNTGSAVTMPWVDRVKGVLEVWYPGQEYGNALAAILFGDANPSAKLPLTFPQSLDQVPAFLPQRWPGVAGRAEHSEGLAVGYRWYDQNELDPLFPFGFGLSYTSFALGGLTVAPGATDDGAVTVEVDVTNTGTRAGAEVVQLYLGHPPGSGEPPRLLRGFQKVHLAAGQSARVRFSLDDRALSHWDAALDRWVASAGVYTVSVGTSSRNLPLSARLELTRTLAVGPSTPPALGVAPASAPEKAADALLCPKDFIAPFVNGVLSLTGFPPSEVLGRPLP